MKIAVLSDIHGNLRGLEAVVADIDKWQPDLVIVNGDIINRGPMNAQCWQVVRSRQENDGWRLVRGNHEDYVLVSADPDAAQSGPKYEMRRFSDWTYRQMRGRAVEIASLPDRFAWQAPDGSHLFVTHASMEGNRIGIYPDTEDAEIRRLIAPAPAVFVTAHTHRPLTRKLDTCTVVNVGSAGLPFDGDWRVSYGRFMWTRQHGWRSKVMRLKYDRDQAERDLVTSGFLDEVGPFGELILVELRLAKGMIHRWSHRYQDDVVAERITLAESVRKFLDRPRYRPYTILPR